MERKKNRYTTFTNGEAESQDLQAVIRELERRLAEAQANIDALVASQIDAVLESDASSPLLLKEAQDALRRSKEELEVKVAERTRDLQETNERLRAANHTLGERNRELAQTRLDLEFELAERRRIEHALRESEERFRLATSAINEGLWDWNLENDEVWWNAAYDRLYGPRPPESTNQPDWWWKHIHSEDRERVFASFHETLNGSSGRWECEYQFVRDDGNQLLVVDRALIARDEDGRALRVTGAMLDMTELKQAQNAIQAYARQLERSNKDLEDFAFMASHDLQEPLRKIQAFGRLLEQETPDALAPRAYDYIQRMQSASARMKNMIDDLLDYSRVATRAQPFLPVDLNSVAQEAVSDLEVRILQTDGIVEVERLPVIEADPRQMRQLLLNLISNGLKFHKPDVTPVVKVWTEAVEGKEKNIEAGETDTPRAYICLHIEDNGIGIDPKFVEQVFQPFKRLHGRTEFEGSGIGLAICRKIAERHQGTISVRSTPNQGSDFCVHLPLEQLEE